MLKTISFNSRQYPFFQTQGNAARFAIPFAKEMLSGVGLDIGCGKQEWAFPGAIPVDPSIDPSLHAFSLPDGEFDYIFSSHCLEHIHNWVAALDYWGTKLKNGGILFLYLPHYSQEYWRPWNNRKHVNVLSHEILRDYFKDNAWQTVFSTEGYDLNNSFYVVAEK